MVLVMSPQAGYEFGGYDVTGVLRDETYEEESVSPEVGAHEPVHLLRLLRLVAYRLHGDEPRLDVAHLVGHAEGGGEPHDETADRGEGDEGEPEPEEDEDLLIEQVHGQRALHRVGVDVPQHADVKVAHGDPWEAIRGRPLDALKHARQNR